MAYRPAGTASSQLCRASAMKERRERYMGGPGRPVPCVCRQREKQGRPVNASGTVAAAVSTTSAVCPRPQSAVHTACCPAAVHLLRC